jgi:hypothetical protein
MAYAATPAAAPTAPAVETIEEVKAPPTIDSHGGKLTPITSSYLEPTNSVLALLAILSVLIPRRLKAFGGVDLTWLRLVPGLLLTAVVAWGLLPTPQTYSHPFYDYYLWVERWVHGALLACCFLNLVADALFPLTGVSVRRSLLAMASSTVGLLILLGLWSVEWFGTGQTRAISFDPAPALVSLVGVPAGVGLLFLWRRFNGWGFELATAFGVFGAVLLGGQLLPFANGISGLTATLVALTVATTLGFGLRGMGRPGWRDLSGGVVWGGAWILRAFLTALSVAVTAF